MIELWGSFLSMFQLQTPVLRVKNQNFPIRNKSTWKFFFFNKTSTILPVKVAVFHIYPSKALLKLSMGPINTNNGTECEEKTQDWKVQRTLIKNGTKLILYRIKQIEMMKLCKQN